MDGLNLPVIDTTFLIMLERGGTVAEKALETLVKHDDRLIVPHQVAIEYLAGLEDPVVGFHMIEASFRTGSLTTEHVLEAAHLARTAFAKGVFPGWADIQIASFARLENTFVVTSNVRHFEALGVLTWDPTGKTAPP